MFIFNQIQFDFSRCSKRICYCAHFFFLVAILYFIVFKSYFLRKLFIYLVNFIFFVSNIWKQFISYLSNKINCVVIPVLINGCNIVCGSLICLRTLLSCCIKSMNCCWFYFFSCCHISFCSNNCFYANHNSYNLERLE